MYGVPHVHQRTVERSVYSKLIRITFFGSNNNTAVQPTNHHHQPHPLTLFIIIIAHIVHLSLCILP